MKHQPQAPEIHDVRTWTAQCPRCGKPTKYRGQYEGEWRECRECRNAVTDMLTRDEMPYTSDGPPNVREMKTDKMRTDHAPEGEE